MGENECDLKLTVDAVWSLLLYVYPFLTLKVFAFFFACEALTAVYTYIYRHYYACIHGLQLLLMLLLMLMYVACIVNVRVQ